MNSPVNIFDKHGLKAQKTRCWALSEEVELAEAKIIGVAASFSVTATICDCCSAKDGKYIDDGYFEFKANVSIAGIIGFSDKFKAPVFGTIGWDVRIAQLDFSKSISATKGCDEEFWEFKWNILSIKGSGGISAAGGLAVLGGSIDMMYNYGVSADLILKESNLSLQLAYGLSGTFNAEISTPLGNYHPVVTGFDETKIWKSVPISFNR